MCRDVSSLRLRGVSTEPAGGHDEDGMESLLLRHGNLGDDSTVRTQGFIELFIPATFFSTPYYTKKTLRRIYAHSTLAKCTITKTLYSCKYYKKEQKNISV